MKGYHTIRVYRRGYNDRSPQQIARVRVGNEAEVWFKIEALRERYPLSQYAMTLKYEVPR
jgi:hypothetical protein